MDLRRRVLLAPALLVSVLHTAGVESQSKADQSALAVPRGESGAGRITAIPITSETRLHPSYRPCQLQELNALVYLTAAIAAHRRRQPPESLLRPTQTP
jgi:hypothetical protein